MRWLEIKGERPLNGRVKIQGSKNSSLGLFAACCLADEPVYLENIPRISDVDVICEILRNLGAVVSLQDGVFCIDPRKINDTTISAKHASAIRPAYYFVGALLAKYGRVSVGYPGGDNFVSRPIDQHFKGLEALGARIEFFQDHYEVSVDTLVGTDIYFDVITCGATINIMMAAVLGKGRTVLHNAARDPEVVDIAILLNKMGARIYGAGTDTIRIEGVMQLGGCTHAVIPDRLIAGAYLMAAGVSGGRVTVEDIVPEHLEACTHKLFEIGMDLEVGNSSITAAPGSSLRATRIRTGMYPVFASDFQQPITALLLKAQGRSTISDRVYPKRFNHCDQLTRMGADITVRNGVARINSYQNLKGTWVHANDIRAGTCLVLAGLMAEGVTYITGVEHIERGYEDLVLDLSQLGAEVKLCQGSEVAELLQVNAVKA